MAFRMIRTAFRRHPVLAAAFALATLIALAFLIRLVVGTIVWQSRAGEPIRPWMTVGYIAHARGLDPRELDKVAGLPLPENGHPFTLDEIARDRGVPVAEIIAKVEAAIAEMKAGEAGDAHDGGAAPPPAAPDGG